MIGSTFGGDLLGLVLDGLKGCGSPVCKRRAIFSDDKSARADEGAKVE